MKIISSLAVVFETLVVLALLAGVSYGQDFKPSVDPTVMRDSCYEKVTVIKPVTPGTFYGENIGPATFLATANNVWVIPTAQRAKFASVEPGEIVACPPSLYREWPTAEALYGKPVLDELLAATATHSQIEVRRHDLAKEEEGPLHANGQIAFLLYGLVNQKRQVMTESDLRELRDTGLRASR